MMSSSKLRGSFPPSRRPALAPPPSDFEVTAAQLERVTWPDDLGPPPATDFESGEHLCEPRATLARGLSSDLDDDVPTLARPTPGRRDEPEPETLAAPSGSILRERFGVAVRYAERVVVVPPGTPIESARAIAEAHAAELRAALPDDAVGRYARVAVFDHAFEGAPRRPPLIDVSDKDWRARSPRHEGPARSHRAAVLACCFGLALGSIATSLLVEWAAGTPTSLRVTELPVAP